MGALRAAALLLQVLLVALPLLLQQAERGRGRRPSQDAVHRRPLPQAVRQYPGETRPPLAQRLQAAALSFVVFGTEVQDGLQPLSLLWTNTDKSLLFSSPPFNL